MPNIEVVGFTADQALAIVGIRKNIEDVFCGKPFIDDMVVTHTHSSVTDIKGKPKPFLRVWDTNEEQGAYIQNVLRMEGYEVERPVQLASFAEAAMWTAEEIMKDLEEMRQGLRSSLSPSVEEINQAVDMLDDHFYSEVAEFYQILKVQLQMKLPGWHPSPEELASKVDLDNVKSSAKTRLIMVTQIIKSLVPPK